MLELDTDYDRENPILKHGALYHFISQRTKNYEEN